MTTKQKKWANARSNDGSMWVWIPRYAYKISEIGYHTSTAESIEIAFLKGTTDQPEEGLLDIKHESGANNWLVHPAFENNVEMGGWDKELTGIWVAKFEAGFAGGGNTVEAKNSSVVNTSGTSNFYGDVTTGVTPLKYPVFIGNTYSYNNTRINDMYNISRALTEEGNPYGFKANTIDSHMMKNSEWGVVVYLGQSKYGKNAEIAQNQIDKNNNPSTICAVTGGNNYVSNTEQSSTGNIYGIYDLNGGGDEYVAAYVNNGNRNLTDYGKSMVEETNLKYKQVYSSYDKEKYGDAIWETSATAGTTSSGKYAWYNGGTGFPYSIWPFFDRGFDYGSSNGAGVFRFWYGAGVDTSYNSWRVALTIM